MQLLGKLSLKVNFTREINMDLDKQEGIICVLSVFAAFSLLSSKRPSGTVVLQVWSTAGLQAGGRFWRSERSKLIFIMIQRHFLPVSLLVVQKLWRVNSWCLSTKQGRGTKLYQGPLHSWLPLAQRIEEKEPVPPRSLWWSSENYSLY